MNWPQQEMVVEDQERRFTLYRLDFKAVILNKDGRKETVLDVRAKLRAEEEIGLLFAKREAEKEQLLLQNEEERRQKEEALAREEEEHRQKEEAIAREDEERRQKELAQQKSHESVVKQARHPTEIRHSDPGGSP